MSTQYWEEEIEIMSREKLQELQLQRLKKTINIAANSPYYKEVFSKNGITGDSIQSLDDIRKIPFTTKSDMRANYPFGLVAGDMKRDGVRTTLPVELQETLQSSYIHNMTSTHGQIW